MYIISKLPTKLLNFHIFKSMHIYTHIYIDIYIYTHTHKSIYKFIFYGNLRMEKITQTRRTCNRRIQWERSIY